MVATFLSSSSSPFACIIFFNVYDFFSPHLTTASRQCSRVSSLFHIQVCCVCKLCCLIRTCKWSSACKSFCSNVEQQQQQNKNNGNTNKTDSIWLLNFSLNVLLCFTFSSVFPSHVHCTQD